MGTKFTDKELMQMLLDRGLGSEDLTKLYKETKEEKYREEALAEARAALVQATINYLDVLAHGVGSVDKEAVEARIAGMERELEQRLVKVKSQTPVNDKLRSFIDGMGW